MRTPFEHVHHLLDATNCRTVAASSRARAASASAVQRARSRVRTRALTEGTAVRRDAELAHAESEQNRDRGLVGGRLAAHRDRNSAVRGAADVPDQAEHAGVERVGQRGDRGVAPLGGERVLGQVVGADADEVEVAAGTSRSSARRRAPRPSCRRAARRAGPRRPAASSSTRARRAEFGDGCDHREHHADRRLVWPPRRSRRAGRAAGHGGRGTAGCRGARGTGSSSAGIGR